MGKGVEFSDVFGLGSLDRGGESDGGAIGGEPKAGSREIGSATISTGVRPRGRPKGSGKGGGKNGQVEGRVDAIPHHTKRRKGSLNSHVSEDDGSSRTSPISVEDRERAKSILDTIGRKFTENRKKRKSTAFEEYQQDLADNMNYLVAGGVMTLKDITQMLMQLEEYRKQSSATGKTLGTLLGEWLRGEVVEDVEDV